MRRVATAKAEFYGGSRRLLDVKRMRVCERRYRIDVNGVQNNEGMQMAESGKRERRNEVVKRALVVNRGRSSAGEQRHEG